MGQERIPDPPCQLLDLHPVDGAVCRVGLLVGFCLLQCSPAHLCGVRVICGVLPGARVFPLLLLLRRQNGLFLRVPAGLRMVRAPLLRISARDMQLHIRVIAAAVVPLQPAERLFIVHRPAEVVGDVLLHALIALRRICRKSHAEMTLVQYLAAVLRHMLPVAEGHPAHRRRLALRPFSPHPQRQQRERIADSLPLAAIVRSSGAVRKIF